MRALASFLLVFVAASWPLTVASAQRQQVDLNLVLAVDVSVSMNNEELEIQRAGYASALTDPDVLRAIKAGSNGRIAIAYYEWAGVTSQRVIVPWTVIGSAEEAAAVAAKLDRMPAWQPRRTSISAALDYGADLLAASPFDAARNVIDISGDGTNNEGRPVTEARDAAIARGITVNGLPLMADLDDFSGNDVARLDVYFDRCVSGGPGSFVIAVSSWDEFPAAIRRKFLMEIAGKSRAPWPPVVQVRAEADYDCMVGERNYRDSPHRNRFSPENFQWPSNRPENWPR